MPRLPGLQLSDPDARSELSPADDLGIAWALGDGLARLHQLTWPHRGTYDLAREDIAETTPSHRDTVLQEIEESVAKCARHRPLTDADHVWADEVVQQSAAALEVPFEPTVVHHDFHEWNTVVTRAGSGWQLSGVFDLMTAYVGDPEEDLSRPIRFYVAQMPQSAPELIAGFVNGYTARRPFRARAEQRFRLYMLRDSLNMWSFGHRPENPWLSDEPDFRAWAERYQDVSLAAARSG